MSASFHRKRRGWSPTSSGSGACSRLGIAPHRGRSSNVRGSSRVRPVASALLDVPRSRRRPQRRRGCAHVHIRHTSRRAWPAPLRQLSLRRASCSFLSRDFTPAAAPPACSAPRLQLGLRRLGSAACAAALPAATSAAPSAATSPRRPPPPRPPPRPWRRPLLRPRPPPSPSRRPCHASALPASPTPCHSAAAAAVFVARAAAAA